MQTKPVPPQKRSGRPTARPAEPAASTPAPRRANAERTEATQAALIAAARALFVDKGYAGTSTPDIAAAAQVTRGALYHHYADKADLFLAVARQMADEVAGEIGQGSAAALSPQQALLDGAQSYFRAMAHSGRANLLLVEAPNVLGADALRELSDRAGSAELAQGLRDATPNAQLSAPERRALTDMLSAAFDRAALAVAQGGDAAPYLGAMRWWLTAMGRS